jgi:hypothetical protein
VTPPAWVLLDQGGRWRGAPALRRNSQFVVLHCCNIMFGVGPHRSRYPPSKVCHVVGTVQHHQLTEGIYADSRFSLFLPLKLGICVFSAFFVSLACPTLSTFVT